MSAVRCFILLAAVCLPVASAIDKSYASGAYSCCFVDAAGKQYTHRGRASSFYRGSIERICRSLAIEMSVRQCNPAVTDMAADFDFTKGPMPATHDLSGTCRKYPCVVGILVAGPAEVADEKGHYELLAASAGLTCTIEQQIHSTIDGWVLRVSVPKREDRSTQPGASCTVVRLKAGKEDGRTEFAHGPAK